MDWFCHGDTICIAYTLWEGVSLASQTHSLAEVGLACETRKVCPTVHLSSTILGGGGGGGGGRAHSALRGDSLP